MTNENEEVEGLAMTWRLRFDDGQRNLPEINVENACGGPVCTIFNLDAEDMANARIILAAPTMLEACQAALQAICAGEGLRESVKQLRAAIAMARPHAYFDRPMHPQAGNSEN